MASATFIGVDSDGFEVRLSIDAPDFNEEFTSQYNEIKSVLAIMGVKPRVAVVTPVKSAPVSAGSFTCQFCGKPVQGTSFNGKDFTPEQIGRTRAEKMARLGKATDPGKSVCGQCWTRGGHAKAWDAFYNANK